MQREMVLACRFLRENSQAAMHDARIVIFFELTIDAREIFLRIIFGKAVSHGLVSLQNIRSTDFVQITRSTNS
jgi:hypothetical protein